MNFAKRWRVLWCLLVFWTIGARAEEKAPADEWTYLDNGRLRLGINKSAGACIGYLSASDSTVNLLNHFDRGRFVQQSYYGDADGSLWGKQPWRYNPVQGGDYRNTSSVVQEYRSTRTTLYAKVTPRHWANGALLPEATMEQWIELKDDLVEIKYRLHYTGDKTHSPRHQEIPAIFVDAKYETLVYYDGNAPWTKGAPTRRIPGWPNEYIKMTENWVAYVDEKDFGLGAYVPVAKDATCYRFLGGRNSNCSYVAPIITFALKPGLVWEYTAFLTLGSSTQIRERFARIRASAAGQ